MSGFKNFLLRGNLIETAVALIMALSFATVVSTFTAWLMSLLPGVNNAFDPDTPSGAFLNAVLAFLVMAAVIYFFIVMPYTKAKEVLPSEAPGEPADVALLTEIRDLLAEGAPRTASAGPPSTARRGGSAVVRGTWRRSQSSPEPSGRSPRSPARRTWHRAGPRRTRRRDADGVPPRGRPRRPVRGPRGGGPERSSDGVGGGQRTGQGGVVRGCRGAQPVDAVKWSVLTRSERINGSARSRRPGSGTGS